MNKRMPQAIFFLMLIMVVMFKENLCFAYGLDTHENITHYSVYSLDYSDNGLKKHLDDNYETIYRANRAEDDDPNWLEHFYNPASGLGLFGINGTAKLRSEGYYYLALHYYMMNNETYAWDRLGHALHLLQDMSVPAHVQGTSHAYHTKRSVGYEYLTTQNWQGISSYVDWLQSNNPYFKRPATGAGDMGTLMEMTAGQTYWGGYDYDDDLAKRIVYPCPNCLPLTITEPHVVSPYNADYAAKILIPQAILSSGSLFQMFWRAVGSGGTPPPPTGGFNNGHPDDNFDVSSRLIQLEELDPTKELWKDLYGRVGIKKGYIELSLNKQLTELYLNYASSTTDEELTKNAAELQTALKQAEAASTRTFEEAYYGSPDIALLSHGFSEETANILLKGLKEPVREIKDSFNPQIRNTQPVFVIPSGGLNGMENSAFLKSSLDEYVKNGGTLIAFAQQHGYEFSILPTPDGKPITAYGWQEDQSCFTNAVYIDTWHQMLSGQNRATPTLNVDGYFTGYPENSTIILRRNANGQPALLMYDHGQGRVIVTSMYSDWAYGHGQASPEEVALVRDMLTWAKKPAALPEIKPGEMAKV